MTADGSTTTPPPLDHGEPVQVRFDCRLAGQPGDTPLYADLTETAVDSILAMLNGYQEGVHPAYALVAITARSAPDDQQTPREFRAWRVARVVALPEETVLYERRRREPLADDDQPDAVVLPLTRAQVETVLVGGVVRVEVLADPYGPPMVVLVRLKQGS
jgi:hypothetical protein